MPATRDLIASSAAALKERVDEVNRLNVFPVPDGDTGTNMSLTMDAVLAEIARLPDDASVAEVCHAVTQGSLMGARGNSGVILSQILRGLCEGLTGAEDADDVATLDAALARADVVAFQAVRKPVEGTMLTVLRDTARAAGEAHVQGASREDALRLIAKESFESVKRTPELLSVLRENGVVDAGGYGLALLIEGFVAAALGEKVTVADVSSEAAPLDVVAPADDWDDDEYLYCTEFLLFGDDIDREQIAAFVSSQGGSELVVGDAGSFKVHVHTNDPGTVLTHVTNFGEVAEVHINNMRRQQAARDQKLREAPASGTKKVGFVAVAAGQGLTEILKSLGVDVIITGGQTMNPSTQDLVDAAALVNAEQIVILPNNKNIVMAANAAASVIARPTRVVPTRSVPQAFSALLAYDGVEDLDTLVEEMTRAAGTVSTGEVTTAVKDAKGRVGDIKTGQVIGIVDDEEIEAVGDSIEDVAVQLVTIMAGPDVETMTLLAGADLDDQGLERIRSLVAERLPDVELETHRGDQPLYPLVISAE